MELIQDGADFEDSGTRPLNHFFDPLRNQPLRPYGLPLFINYTSPDWALEDNGKIGKQEYSFRDARDSLYKALTLADPKERDKNFGLTFQTLGQVIHHIQDMAQPQHVRNDVHLDQPKEFDILGVTIPNPLYNPSRYEKYTQGRGGNLPFSGYPLVTFTKARDYWTGGINGNGQGLADFTNANFLSAGTNFALEANGQPAVNARYRLPAWNGTLESVTFWGLLKKEGIDCTAATGTPASTPRSLTVAIIIVPPPPTVPDLPPACQLNGEMVFYGTTVTDNYLGTPGVNNPRASTLSSFDQDLEKNNLPLTFSLNRFNFQYAYPHLIPKAVGYSAGLIDYFFRGKLEAGDAAFSDTGVALRVRNAIDLKQNPKWKDEILYPSAGAGVPSTLTLVYEYKDAQGTKQYGISNTVNLVAEPNAGGGIAPGETSRNVYEFTLSVPANATEVKYRVVFRGKLGQEDGAVAVGSVKPASGFTLLPSYAPADGISGTRVIYKHAGKWKLSSDPGLAGNIDWKGRYVNGKPTTVLTWLGPQARYFPDKWGNGIPVDNFTPQIYQGGDIFAVAPSLVLGAAITKDALGKEWLIAICREGMEDVVYRRPNKKSESSAMLDPVVEPDGWEKLGGFAPGPGDRMANIPWFFSGDGTKAQTMREWVDSADPYARVQHKRLMISFNPDGTAKRDNLGNDPGYEGQLITAGSCDGQGIGSVTITGSYGGKYIVAVDYVDDREVLARLTREESGTWNITNLGTSGGSYTYTSKNSDIETLRIDGRMIRLGVDIYTQSASGSGDNFSETTKENYQVSPLVYFLDLRAGVVSSSYEGADLLFNVTSSAGVTTGSMALTQFADATITASPSDVRVFRREKTTSPTPTRTVYPICAGMSGGTLIYPVEYPSPDYVPVDTFPLGWAVDTNGNLLVSQTYFDYSSSGGKLPLFTHLTGGDVGTLIPVSPGADATYYPVGLIR